MAANALEIITLQDARAAMRLVGEDAVHDALISAYIQGAAQWIEARCRLGIVDTPEEQIITPTPGQDYYLRHRSPAIVDPVMSQLTGVPSWSKVTAVEDVYSPGQTVLKVPTTGWPAAQLRIAYQRSTPAGQVPGAIRAAMFVLVRDMYDVRETIDPGKWAAEHLLTPYVDNSIDPHALPEFPTPQHRSPVAGKALIAAWSDQASADVSLLESSLSTSTGTSIVLPAGTGQRYLIIWRSNAAGGLPTRVTGAGIFGNLPLQNGGSLAPNHIDGVYVVSASRQDVEIFGGETLEVQ